MDIMNRVLFLCIVLVTAACSQQSSEDYLNSAKKLIEQQDLQAASIEL